MGLTRAQVAAIKMKAGTYKHSRYFRKRDAHFVDKYNRNVITPKGRILGRDVIVHQSRPAARATREYKIGRR